MLRLKDVHDTPLDWLVENLWTGVGIIGGQPKTQKTFLALDIAIAVTSGNPVKLGDRLFSVPKPGPLVYLCGEGSESDIKRRIKVPIPDDLYIDSSKPQLDTQKGRLDIISMIADVRAKALIIDPFVRFHTTNENQVTPMLGFLSGLKIHVILVHHMKKGGIGGQGLRGSGDLHAWGDSNIYTLENNFIQTEFRNAPSEIICRSKSGGSQSLMDTTFLSL